MKILVLNGSPRNETSNTMKLTDAFVSGMREKENHGVDTISVNRMNIKPCAGCFGCWAKTPGECVLKDDMSGLLQTYRESDIVIWSFPLYYFGMPSGIKAFMDRLLPNNLPYITETADGRGTHPRRYDLSGQRHIIISTCGFHSITNNYDAVVKQFEIIFGHKLPAILCPEGELFRVPQLVSQTSSYLDRVRQAGVEFAKTGGLSNETQSSLNAPMVEPELFMEMANANWDIQLAENGVQLQNSDSDEVGLPDISHAFMRQMRAVFNPEAAGDKSLILEMYFTDIDKTYQFHIANGKCDLKQGAPAPYTTRIETSFSVWKDISDGKLDGVKAMMEHKYKTLGSFDTMLIMNDLFSTAKPSAAKRPDSAPEVKAKEKKANMAMLLIPWLALWAVMPINQTAGAVLGILSSLYLVGNNRFARNPYETVSAVALTVLCLTALCGLAPMNIILITGKAVWAGMWLVSSLCEIPLSAYYSCYGYGFGGPEKAFKNGLFLKTNRILSMAWGAFTTVMSIVAYFFLQTEFASFFGLLDQIAPLFMGIFTLWFAKWYPARVARG